MSQLEEAVARLTQARSKLAPITKRIFDIETRLAVLKTAERPAKVSLREFTSNFVRPETATFALDHDDRKVWNGCSLDRSPLGDVMAKPTEEQIRKRAQENEVELGLKKGK
jgi:hypothetical protein